METRETVWEETPARRATSAMEARWTRRSARAPARTRRVRGVLAEALLSALSTHAPSRPQIRGFFGR
ncbi:hypothetical protein GCM10010246_46130 [Streptomyces cuspidosporus]|uniref:Uncharacterized protein n=1 Tax=Streptomyces cuspidosporus TaxID=66882 RepID=A0ABN3GIB9_9ACTN